MLIFRRIHWETLIENTNLCTQRQILQGPYQIILTLQISVMFVIDNYNVKAKCNKEEYMKYVSKMTQY
jgi:hypothetical protein